MDKDRLLDETVRKWKFLPVYRCGGDSLKKPFYTVVRAKMPQSWGCDVERERVDQDIKQFSYKTSLGPAQFHVQVQNRASYLFEEKMYLMKGRPRKVGNFHFI